MATDVDGNPIGIPTAFATAEDAINEHFNAELLAQCAR